MKQAKIVGNQHRAAVFGNLQCFWAPFKNNGGKFKNFFLYISNGDLPF